MARRKVFLWALFFLLLVPSLACFSQETSEDYWQEQRDYYQQYQAWELPTGTIVNWLNLLEQSEKDLTAARNESSEALSILNPLKEDLERVLRLLEEQHNQSVRQTTAVIVTSLAVTTLLILLR